MKYVIQKLQEDPIRILLVIIIVVCIIGLIRAVREVHGWWRAWSIEEQKKKPSVRYPIHFDKRT